MTQNKLDISQASLAIKENRFAAALTYLKSNLKENPDHIDSLYLAAVSSRYLKKFDLSKEYLERLLIITPDMGRAYQELGHLNRDIGNTENSITHYRQACELNPALLASWKAIFNYFVEHNNQPAADHALEHINKLQSIPNVLLYINQILNEGKLGIA